MKLFIDDLRNPPDDTWTIARTGQEAIVEIGKDIISWTLFEEPRIEIISFDHDLADTNTPEVTGYTVLQYIEELVYTSEYKPPALLIHSANPVGRKNMQRCIESIQRKING
jgi:hypothetical protein